MLRGTLLIGIGLVLLVIAAATWPESVECFRAPCPQPDKTKQLVLAGGGLAIGGLGFALFMGDLDSGGWRKRHLPGRGEQRR